MKNKIGFLIMRLGLGTVFLLFGIGKFQNDIWAQTIKGMDFFLRLPWKADISVFLIGIVETLTGLALIFGIFRRFFSTLAAAQLLGILTLLKFQETRDIGLLAAAICLVLAKEDYFSLGWLWKKGRKRT